MTTNNRERNTSNCRAGMRKDRTSRIGKRIPELGYYLIVTDTEETEKNYFEGLRNSIPPELKNRLIIKVEKARTMELVTKALELVAKESQYRIPWIVFDRDQIKGFDELIKKAETYGVHVGWSNPCFEIWMYAYFGEMPVIRESYMCCDRFSEKFEKVTGQKYLKNDRRIYNKLEQYGDFEKAVAVAERNLKNCIDDGKKLPSEMYSVCTVQRLVEEIYHKTHVAANEYTSKCISRK